MKDKPISSYPLPDLNALPKDVRDKILEVQDKAGFIPNVFLTLAYRPDEFRAFFAYHDALMLRDSKLSKAEREMIVVATSGVNHCTYCVIAHGAILRIYQKDPLISDQIAIDPNKADITDKQKVMLSFAVKLARSPETITPTDHKLLQDHGFGKDEIWDIGAITAFFALSNRMAHLIEMRANDEFYLMGRQAKSKN
jgi:uncharacterized peroxidase-related enzyme